MDDKTMLDLVKSITQQGTKLDNMIENTSRLAERMTKLEALREQDIKQNEKIEQILIRLQQGNEHFERVDSRLTILEEAEGKKAKDLIKQITGIIVATCVGAFLSNIGVILKLFIK